MLYTIFLSSSFHTSVILTSDKFYHITQDNYARKSALLENLSAHKYKLNIYQYNIWSNLLNATIWYYNYRIVCQHSP